MSSQRYQKQVSWGAYNRLAVQIWHSTEINDETRMELARELQVHGREATPDVAQRFKKAKKEAKNG